MSFRKNILNRSVNGVVGGVCGGLFGIASGNIIASEKEGVRDAALSKLDFVTFFDNGFQSRDSIVKNCRDNMAFIGACFGTFPLLTSFAVCVTFLSDMAYESAYNNGVKFKK